MSKSCILLAVIVLGIGLCAPFVAAGDETTEATAKSVTLAEVRRAPESFRGVPCAFDLTFHAFTQVYNPYFTRFVPETYINFSAWEGQQKIWTLQEYQRDFPYLFVSKANANLAAFLALKRFDRVRVVGTIRDTFKGNPWIEVHSMTSLEGKLTEKALVHRVRGDVALSKNRPRIAVKEYEQALAEAGLPHDYVCESMKQLGMALYRARDFEAAAVVFAKAASLEPEDKHSAVLARQADARARERQQAQDRSAGDVLEGAEGPADAAVNETASGPPAAAPNVRK
ncbi:MAG: hypothetical protein JXQ29_12890 [Planctomycetes bacterium]|nr:hypothetical protein [Planctomycetota bacterium]